MERLLFWFFFSRYGLNRNVNRYSMSVSVVDVSFTIPNVEATGLEMCLFCLTFKGCFDGDFQ